MKTNVNESQTCPNCQKPLPSGALAGLCPACLIAQGFESNTDGPKNAGAQPLTVEQVAKLFPQLEILSFLGAGGMGAVYKARQPALDRDVALKLLPPNDTTHGRNFEDRFNREARALARLSHPNIVALHEFGQTEGHHYFLMEFVDGANLRQLERSNRLSPREALQVIPQICDALQYAHDEGVVHRDIKPENVLVDRKGRVKIADFGLAMILEQNPDSLRLTAEGQVMGTPHYMAPEQVERPLAVDHRADIYSLGVVFYELLTGDLPIGNFSPPSRKVQIDVRFDEVVLRALENDPNRRYQKASEVKSRVETISGTPSPDATPAPQQSPSAQNLKRTDQGTVIVSPPPLSRWRTPVLWIGVVTLLLSGIFLLQYQRAKRKQAAEETALQAQEIARQALNTPVVSRTPSPSQDSPPPATPEKLAAEPVLRFIAWQGEVPGKVDPDRVYHPDGSPLNPEDHPLLRSVRTGGVNPGPEFASKRPRFLHLWFAHELFDRESQVGITLSDQENVPLKLGAAGSTSSTGQIADEHSAGLGWLTTTISPGEGDLIPTNINVRLDYAIGPLERRKKVAPNFSGGMSLEGNSMLNGVGQDAGGKAFVAIAVDTASLGPRQFGVRAVTKDGRELRQRGGGNNGAVGRSLRVFRFEFDPPLSEIDYFLVGTRPVRTIEWKNVTLPPLDP